MWEVVCEVAVEGSDRWRRCQLNESERVVFASPSRFCGTRPERLMLSLGKTVCGAKPSQTNRRGLRLQAQPGFAAIGRAVLVPPQNPRARAGRGFDARVLHAWNK